MNFIEPTLALCSNRSVLAKENPVLPGPNLCISNSLLSEQDLCGISFDYFIDWSTNKLDRDLWLKCPAAGIGPSDLLNLKDEDIADVLREHIKFRDLVRFSEQNSCGATAVIFDDSQDWSQDSSTLIIAHWPKDPVSSRGLDVTRPHISRIKEIIRSKSGGPISIGDKGLIYGTSRLECYLSRTDALWPGDADLLLCDRLSMKPIALIEYKKHTESSKKTFQEQCISNYYPYPDGRKYDRLALLAEQIAHDSPIKIFTLYYSTIASELDVKLEEIVGMHGKLKAGSQYTFGISPADPKNGYRNVIAEIKKYSI
jgi:hypothetical protein